MEIESVTVPPQAETEGEVGESVGHSLSNSEERDIDYLGQTYKFWRVYPWINVLRRFLLPSSRSLAVFTLTPASGTVSARTLLLCERATLHAFSRFSNICSGAQL